MEESIAFPPISITSFPILAHGIESTDTAAYSYFPIRESLGPGSTFGSGVSGGGRCPKLAEKRTSSLTDLLSSTFESPERRVTSILLRLVVTTKVRARRPIAEPRRKRWSGRGR